MMNLRRSRFFRPIALNPARYALRGFIFLCFALLVFGIAYFALPALFAVEYNTASVASSTPDVPIVDKWRATHLPTPKPLKAIYMTACVVGTPSFRDSLVQLIDTTELNAVVIDIKDFTGTLSFVPEDSELKAAVSKHCYAPDMREFVESLHAKGIYVIGRISVFQDPLLVAAHPELAVKRRSDGGVWKDYKGLNFTDPGSKEVWDYIVAIGKESYNAGFDELNFDYIRFPSDGNMKDIAFSWTEDVSKSEQLRRFFSYLSRQLKPLGAALSADLFGMTTTNTDDLNIGQVLENALPYFDYIAPMVYPSHYPPHFMGFLKPAEKPYEVVKFSMDGAVRRTVATSTVVKIAGAEPLSTTTKPYLYPKESYSAQKIRPWLQDFNLGATYTAEMVKKQIQATYDSGLTSWMLWNAGNRYTKDALAPE